MSVKRNMRDMARLQFTKPTGRDMLRKRLRKAKIASYELYLANLGTAVRSSKLQRKSLTTLRNMVALT